MALIDPDYIDCVVALGIIKNKKKRWIGTGFFFGKIDKVTDDNFNKYKVFLVTNKHVIEGADNMIVRINSKNKGIAQDYTLVLKNSLGKLVWTGHPNKEVDVMVTSFDISKIKDDGMKYSFFMSDKNTMNITQMKTNNVSEGDFVFTMGYPMELLKPNRQHVFIRSGVISRIQDLYEGDSNDFVIDSFVFPGNSGGPVLLKPEFISASGTTPNKSSSLIGLVKSYIPYTEEAISLQTEKTRIFFEENTGLTLVEPVNHIIETIKEWENINLP